MTLRLSTPQSDPTDAILQREVREASAWIAGRWPVAPSLGIVLGTGSGELADQIRAEVTLAYEEIPHFRRATAVGHRGRLVCGRLHGAPVAAWQGRFHRYEGYSADEIALPIRVLHRLGARRLLISNAAGGLQPGMTIGQLMLITGHIPLFFARGGWLRPGGSTLAAGVPRPTIRSDQAYCPSLAERVLAAARAHDVPLVRGVYAGVLGPNFETRAEYRMLRRLGADAVGMSTLDEVEAAAELGIATLAVSIITNVARPDALIATSGEAVHRAGETAASALSTLFASVVAP